MSTARQARRRARIESILDAAMTIVLDDGVHALTMRRLATAVGLTPGAMYRYFDGKDAILARLGQRTLGRYADALDLRESDARYEAQRAFLDDDAAALYALLARAWRYFELSVEDPAGWRLINLFLVSPRRIIEDQTHLRLMALVSAQLQRVAALSDEAVGAGALRPGRGLNRALVVFATLNGHLQYLKLAHTSGLGFTPAHTVSLGLDTVLAGWGARAEARDAAWKLLRHHAELAVPQLDS